MAKDWDDKGYWGKQNSINDIGEQLGINYRDYSDNDTETGRNYTSKGTRSDYEQAVLNAAANNYDMRSSIEAGKASGNKRFADIGDGISNLAELDAVNTAMRKTHKKDMGNTGSFSSANDYGNVTSYLNKAAATSAKDEIMNAVDDQISQAMTSSKSDDDSSSSSTNNNMTYNEFLGLEGEVQKASSGFGATDTPAQQAQGMLFNAVNKIAKDEDNMDKAKFNQDKYNLEIGPGIFN
jgi:hypothetical protein